MRKIIHNLLGIYLVIVVLAVSINPMCAKGTVITEEVKAEITESKVSGNTVSDDVSYWDRYSSYYYYNQLSEEEKEIWDDLEELCKYYLKNDVDITQSYTREIELGDRTMGELSESLASLVDMFEYSHPQYSFFQGGAAVSRSGESNVVELEFLFEDEMCDGSNRMEMIRETKEQLDEWNEIVEACDTDYEKVLKIAQLLCGEKIYDLGNVYNQSLYNTVCNEGIVCQGYALAFNMLSNYAGIESLCVPSDNKGEPHVWNMVKLNGIWYHIDVTWMDEEERVNYGWFLRADKYANKNAAHITDEYFISYVPKCHVDVGSNEYIAGECPEIAVEQVSAPNIILTDDGSKCVVEISCDEDSVIYYTTDGTLPSPYEKCHIYQGTFEVDSNTPVKAMAVKAGCIDSEIASTGENESCIVSFDTMGGKIDTNEKSVIKGNNYGFLPRPTKEGYVFTGWYVALDSGEEIKSSDIVEKTENHTLYAGWKKKEIKGHIYNRTQKGIDWSLNDEGNLTIVGTGEIYDDGEWYAYKEAIVTAEVSLTEITNMNRMFYSFPNLKEIQFIAMDTSQVNDMSEMFSYCIALEKVDLSGFDMSNVETANNMFFRTDAMATIQTPLNVTIDIDLPSNQFIDSQGNYVSLLPRNTDVSEKLVNVVDVRFMNSKFIVEDLELSRISIKRFDGKSEFSMKVKTIAECESRRITLNFFLMDEEGEIVDKVTFWQSTLGEGEIIDYSMEVNRIIKEGVVCEIRPVNELYEVILNNQGATEAGTLSVDVSYESDMPDITIPQKEGYVFDGYYSGEQGTGERYYDSKGVGLLKYPYIEGVVLYAYWDEEESHTYGEPEYEWSENGKRCSVIFTCANDENHKVREEAAVTSTVKTEATCKEMGITTYIASCSFEGESYTDSKDVQDVEKDANSHVSETETRNAKEATCGEEGYTGDTYCKGCGENLATGTTIAKKSAHVWNAGVVTKEPTTTQKGEMTYICNVCKTTKTEEISLKSASDNKESDTEESKQPLQVGETDISDDGTATYEVTSSDAENGTVLYVAPSDKKITKVTIPDAVVINGITYNVTAIEKNAFKNNKNIKSVTIGENVKIIGANAFYNCTKLTSVKLGSNVTSIGDKAFYKCTLLTKVNIPSKAKTIGKQTFYGCKKVSSITIGKNVNKIGSKAFYGCSKVKTLTIKSTKLTTKSVGSKAFGKTPKSMTVKIPKKKFDSYKSLLIKRGVNKQAKFKKS